VIALDDYHRMIDAGVFAEDEHVELIEGVIVGSDPQSPEHARVISRLQKLLRSIGDEWVVRTQLPLTLARSEPEPDLAICRQADEDAAPRHPTSVALVIEVARDSLQLDRAKAALYAEAQIDEYWVVDVERQQIEVHREARAGAYQQRSIARAGDTLALPALGLQLALGDIFPAH